MKWKNTMARTQPIFSPSLRPLFWMALTSDQIQKTIRNTPNSATATTTASGARASRSAIPASPPSNSISHIDASFECFGFTFSATFLFVPSGEHIYQRAERMQKDYHQHPHDFFRLGQP